MKLRLPSVLRALAVALLPLAAGTLAAQQPSGSVAGEAIAAEGGAPIPLSLVLLLPGRGGDEPLRSVLTGARGEFRFDGVPAGRYRLRMDRIGFVAAPSEPFEVRPGEAVRRVLSGGARPVQLEGISVEGDACYTLDRLDEAPDLATLWREAQKALETRRRFLHQYRFTYDRRIRGTARLRMLRDKRVVEDSVVTSTPDSVAAREARLWAERARSGYGQKSRGHLTIAAPNDVELLADGFLATHCLEGDAGDGTDGTWTLRFRPVRGKRPAGAMDIRGVVRLDAGSYTVREVVYEYLDGSRPFARMTMRYEDVRTPDGVVRLPVGGTFRGDPGGTMGLVVQDFEGTLTLGGYRGFQRVGGAGRPQA